MKKEKSNWDSFINMEVRLIIEDIPFPKPKDGIFISHDITHVFLKHIDKPYLVPYLKSSIKRVDVK